jgi:hypothetical protein
MIPFYVSATFYGDIQAPVSMIGRRIVITDWGRLQSGADCQRVAQKKPERHNGSAHLGNVHCSILNMRRSVQKGNNHFGGVFYTL